MSLDDHELEALLADVESDRVERKASLSDKEKICEAICAFANDLPDHRQTGVVFIGADDEGSCAGLKVTDQLLLTLADLRSNGNIYPFPSLVVGKRSIGRCEMAVIEVQPSQAPPVRFRGRVWVRVGPRRSLATPEEERRLGEKRRTYDPPFELRPVPEATLEDLDLLLFEHLYLPAAVTPEVITQNDRPVEARLASLRMVTADTSYTPTNLGVLSLGKDPRRFVPGAYIQFLRLEGTELAAPIRHQAVIDGALPDLLRRLDEVLSANLSIATDIAGGAVEIQEPDYPIAALQQLSRNAVLHRNYEGTNAPARLYWFADRVEIHSPGGPYGQVSRENFGSPGVTDYRNLHLAEVMKTLGYVQRFGLGIALAQKALADNGNPPAEFQVGDSYIVATLWRRS